MIDKLYGYNHRVLSAKWTLKLPAADHVAIKHMEHISSRFWKEAKNDSLSVD